jgi:hypothetical protein
LKTNLDFNIKILKAQKTGKPEGVGKSSRYQEPESITYLFQFGTGPGKLEQLPLRLKRHLLITSQYSTMVRMMLRNGRYWHVESYGEEDDGFRRADNTPQRANDSACTGHIIPLEAFRQIQSQFP